MPLLLLPRGIAASDVIDEPPTAGTGTVTQFPATSGAWRIALEIAAADEFPDWFDITQFYVGDRHQFGANDYKGKARARLVEVQIQIDNVQAADLGVSVDILAPWGQDTTSLFGENIRLGAGLLIRLSMYREVASVVVETLPIWTGRVEQWGDASAARGQVRTHVVSVVDTMSSLAQTPVAIVTPPTYWPEWFTDEVLPQAGWQFGVDVYGDLTSGGLLDIDTMPAINAMDAGTDPLGLVWRTLRSGRMVIHPAPWDTTNTNRYTNPLLDVYPDGLRFTYAPDFTDIEYIADDDQQPFGIQRSIAGVLNSFVVTWPDGFSTTTYAVDDPVSTGRYDIRPFTASWFSPGNAPQTVDDLLADRAYSESQALPLRTTIDHEGFWPALAMVDHLDPVTIIHADSDDGLVVTGTGWIRNIIEERTVRDDGLLNWQSTVQIDIDSTETSEPLLPVENLRLVSTESPLLTTTSTAEFSWDNPVQPSITPTDMQYRVIGRSNIWLPKSYPGVGPDGLVTYGLEAGTRYTFQVRLLRKVDGVVTNFSAWRAVTFTTPFRIYPVPVPDGDHTGGEFGEPPDDCGDFSVELQENDGTGWTTVDTFSGAELTDNGDGTYSLTTPIDNSFFNVGSMYRFVTLCDGDIITVGPEFDPPDDWTDPCPTPDALSTSPFNDGNLLVYVPKVCTGAEDGDPDFVFQGMQIIEAVSGIAGVHGDALAEIQTGITSPTSHALLAISDPAWSDTPGGILAYGECPQIIGVTGDKTIQVRLHVGDDTQDCVLGECAAMRLTVTPVGGGGLRPGVTVYKPGSTISLAGVSVLSVGNTYVIRATHELATGTITIAIDGTLDNSVGGTDDVPTINALPIWRVGAPPDSWITDFAVFDSVIVPAFSPDDLPNLVFWLDASDTATISDTAGAVDSWGDKANPGRVVLQSGALRPTTGSRTQNGLNVVDFDGTQYLTQRGGGTNFVTWNSATFTAFIVCASDADSATAYGFWTADDGTSGGGALDYASTTMLALFHQADASNIMGTDINSVGLTLSGATATPPDVYSLRKLNVSSSNNTTLMRGAGTASATGTTNHNSGAGNLMAIGCRIVGGPIFPVNGFIAEVILYDDALSDVDRDTVIDYLKTKWGL